MKLSNKARDQCTVETGITFARLIYFTNKSYTFDSLYSFEWIDVLDVINVNKIFIVCCRAMYFLQTKWIFYYVTEMRGWCDWKLTDLTNTNSILIITTITCTQIYDMNHQITCQAKHALVRSFLMGWKQNGHCCHHLNGYRMNFNCIWSGCSSTSLIELCLMHMTVASHLLLFSASILLIYIIMYSLFGTSSIWDSSHFTNRHSVPCLNTSWHMIFHLCTGIPFRHCTRSCDLSKEVLYVLVVLYLVPITINACMHWDYWGFCNAICCMQEWMETLFVGYSTVIRYWRSLACNGKSAFGGEPQPSSTIFQQTQGTGCRLHPQQSCSRPG